MVSKGSEFERSVAHEGSEAEKAASEKLTKQTQKAEDAKVGKGGMPGKTEDAAPGQGGSQQTQGGRR